MKYNNIMGLTIIPIDETLLPHDFSPMVAG